MIKVSQGYKQPLSKLGKVVMLALLPGQIQAVRHTSQIVDQSLLQKEPYDIVHAIVLCLGCCCAIEAGRGGT